MPSEPTDEQLYEFERCLQKAKRIIFELFCFLMFLYGLYRVVNAETGFRIASGQAAAPSGPSPSAFCPAETAKPSGSR